MIICSECCLVMVPKNEGEDVGILLVEFGERDNPVRAAYGSRVHCVKCGKIAYSIEGLGTPATSDKFWGIARAMYKPGSKYIAFETPVIERKE